MSQGDVAASLGWSLSKVQRIEGGEVTISGTDLRAMLSRGRPFARVLAHFQA
jgi:hypothetical protein